MKRSLALAFALTGCFDDTREGWSTGLDESGTDGADASSGTESGDDGSSGSESGSGGGSGSSGGGSSGSGEESGSGGSTSGSEGTSGSSGGTSESSTAGETGSGESGSGEDSDSDGESSGESGSVEPDLPDDPGGCTAGNCAVAFDGGSGRTTATGVLQDALGTSSGYSFEIWVRRTGDVLNEYILDTRRDDGWRGIALYQTTSVLTLEVFFTADKPTCKALGPSLNTFELDRWHSIAFSAQGDQFGGYSNLYVDGIRQSIGSDCYTLQEEYPIHIGEAFDGSSRLSSLQIDNIRIREGSPLYDGYTPEPTPQLAGETLALWHFDEGMGDVAFDESPSGLDLNLNNHEWVNH